MDQVGPQTKIHRSIANEDIISNLPEVLKDRILCCLPIKQAVRTCILSRKWRYTWASMTELVFSDVDFASVNGNENDVLHGFLRFTDMFLSLHNGPILKFRLKSRRVQMMSTGGYIYRWMLMLSRNGVKEIEIKTSEQCNYEIPSCFFSCDGLEYAYLQHCVFQLPPEFKGFNRLHTLHIGYFCTSGNNVGDLVASCPNLEKLVLYSFRSVAVLNIHSTKLKKLFLDGLFHNLNLHAPHLTAVFIRLRVDNADASKPRCNFNVAQFVSSLPGVKRIALLGRFFECFAYEFLPHKLPKLLNWLTKIALEIDLGKLDEAKVALCLFQNAPNLRYVEFKFVSRSSMVPTVHFWESIHRQARLFQNLDIVCMVNFTGSCAELGFLKLLLEGAPMLREAQIKDNGKLDKEALKNLLKMRRASTGAQILVL